MSPRQVIWAALIEAARTGAPCPTNQELGELVGYAHKSSAAVFVNEMIAEGKIITRYRRNRAVRRFKIDGKWTNWTKSVRRDPSVPIKAKSPTASRKCLCCSKKFESKWVGERICKRCKSTANWRGAAIV